MKIIVKALKQIMRYILTKAIAVLKGSVGNLPSLGCLHADVLKSCPLGQTLLHQTNHKPLLHTSARKRDPLVSSTMEMNEL